jgi:hypothetical protein
MEWRAVGSGSGLGRSIVPRTLLPEVTTSAINTWISDLHETNVMCVFLGIQGTNLHFQLSTPLGIVYNWTTVGSVVAIPSKNQQYGYISSPVGSQFVSLIGDGSSISQVGFKSIVPHNKHNDFLILFI